MFNILKAQKFVSQKVYISPSIEFLLKKSLVDIKRVENFYRDFNGYVKNDHILVRVIKTFNPDFNLSFTDYLHTIDDSIEYLCRHFYFSSYTAKAKLDNDTVYVNYSLTDNYFNVDYKTAKPLKPILSDSTDLSMRHPLADENLYTIVLIDIKLLLVSLYKFVKETGSYDVHNFLFRFTLTNMIRDRYNLSILNIALGKEIKNYSRNIDINIADRTKYYDAIYMKFRTYANKKAISFKSVLNSIYLLEDTTADKYLDMYYPIVNSYNFKPFFLIYSSYFKRLALTLGENVMKFNMNETSDITLILKLFRSMCRSGYDLSFLNNIADENYNFIKNFIGER